MPFIFFGLHNMRFWRKQGKGAEIIFQYMYQITNSISVAYSQHQNEINFGQCYPHFLYPLKHRCARQENNTDTDDL